MKAKIINDINLSIYQLLHDNEVLQKDPSLQEMLYYALGFSKDGSLLESGKRLRPFFCCLVCGTVSDKYTPSLEYAAALEMLHNYTLIHDDIEDNSDTRHNRPALWKRNGLALAINAGDLLYEIAISIVMNADRITEKYGLQKIMSVSEELYLGQHRDISFENRIDISETEYLQMVEGKTSALLGCSFALGAIAGGADDDVVSAFESAGRKLGTAFQIRDDFLGTWGDSLKLGKSVFADIMDKKNTLAVIYTAEKDPEFKNKWLNYDGSEERVPEFAKMMEKAGAPEYLIDQCQKYSKEAGEILETYKTENAFYNLLYETILSLTDRNK